MSEKTFGVSNFLSLKGSTTEDRLKEESTQLIYAAKKVQAIMMASMFVFFFTAGVVFGDSGMPEIVELDQEVCDFN